MENFDFDDMLRHGLSHTPSDARFEFKEEYWLQAKALLDADMRRQKRRRVLGYAFVLTMLLVPAAAIYRQRQPMAPAKAIPQAMPTQEMAQQQQPMAMLGNAPLSANTGVQNDKIGQIFKKAGNDATQSNVTASTIQIPSETQSTANSTTNTFPQSTGNLTKNNQPPQNNQIENGADLISPTLPIQAAPFLTSDSYRPTHTSEDKLESVPYRNTLDLLPTTIAAPSRSVGSSPMLGLGAVVLQPISNPTHLIKHKHDDKPFKMGLVASLSTPSGLFFEEQPGMALGAAARYRIYKKIYLGADLLWRRNSGNQNIGAYAVAEQLGNQPGVSLEDAYGADLVQQSNNTNYSFGYTNTQINSAVRILHQIELPLSIQVQWRRFALESGLSLTTRLLARRVTEQYTQSSLMPAGTLSSKDSYFESYTDNTPRINRGLIGGLHWQPLKHWRVGCRVNWSLLDNSGIQYRNNGFNDAYQKDVLNIAQKRAITAELRTAYLF